MKILLVFTVIVSIFMIGCSMPVGSGVEDTPVLMTMTDYESYYGPAIYESVVVDADGISYTRALFNNVSSGRAITFGDLISATFISGNVVDYDLASLAPESEIVNAFRAKYSLPEITGDALNCHYASSTDVTPLYDSDDTECFENYYRVTSIVDGYACSTYVWNVDSPIFEFAWLDLQHVTTFADSTEIYGLIYSSYSYITPSGSTTSEEWFFE